MGDTSGRGKRKEPEPESTITTSTLNKDNGKGQVAGTEGKVASLDKQDGKVANAGNRQRSPVWNHFTIIESSDPENRRAQCVHCGKTYACHPNRNGTSSLSNHIKNSCKKKPLKQEKSQTTLLYEPNKESDGGGNSLVPYSFSLEACRKALAHMIIVDELPFRFVEAPGFRHFMRVVQPKFSAIPSRITIARDCLKLYLEEKNKLMSFMKGHRVCITTDTWTSLQNTCYMCVTAHFIDQNWCLHKKIINFCLVENHKGETIGRTLEACLLEWGLDKILTVTMDNASSNNVFILLLKKKSKNWKTVLNNEFMHMRCCAHILNLIVNDGLNEMHESIEKVRNVVKYVRSSPSRLLDFKKAVEKEKLESKKLLCLDVETRWNSTYMMLDAACKFQKAFERMGEEDSSYKHYFHIGEDEGLEEDVEGLNDYVHESEIASENGMAKGSGKGRGKSRKNIKGAPNDNHWDNAKTFVKFLKMFYDATLRFSGSVHVTSNEFFHELYFIQNKLRELSSSNDFLLGSMAIQMKNKYDKYWGNLDRINLLLFVAVVLDPRFKMRYVSFCFKNIYDSSLATNMTNKVKDAFVRMYDWYAKYEVSIPVEEVCEKTDYMEVEGLEEDDRVRTIKQFKKQLRDENDLGNKSEVDKYLAENCEDESADFSILNWWKVNSGRYHILSQIARDVLAVPISTVASESGFSTCGRILNFFRSSLSPSTVQALMCTQSWLQDHARIDVNESMKDLEFYENIESEILGGTSCKDSDKAQ